MIEQRYAQYVLEEQRLFKEILTLKEQALRTKLVLKATDKEVRVWRNQIKAVLPHKKSNQTDDITAINYDIARIPREAENATQGHLEVQEEYVRLERRINSLLMQVASLSTKDAVNVKRVQTDLERAGEIVHKNILAIRNFKRSITIEKKQRDMMIQEALEVIKGYIGVPDIGVIDVKINGDSVKFAINTTAVGKILENFDRGQYYPTIPFSRVSSWGDSYKKEYTKKKPLEYRDEIIRELADAVKYFETSAFWEKLSLAPKMVKLAGIPRVRMVEVSAGIDTIPKVIYEELKDYATGSFSHTVENVNRINEIANVYRTPNIEVKVPTGSANQLSKRKLMQLTEVVANFDRTKTKLGMVIRIRELAIQLMKAQDKGFVALSKAYEEFESETAKINSWVSDRWYQFGGTPVNDTAYNGRGNAKKWGGKKWY